MLYSDYLVHVMGHVPYVGFATYRRATLRTRFTFCIKKKMGCHNNIRRIIFIYLLICINDAMNIMFVNYLCHMWHKYYFIV
jgi:hypothetical protein